MFRRFLALIVLAALFGAGALAPAADAGAAIADGAAAATSGALAAVGDGSGDAPADLSVDVSALVEALRPMPALSVRNAAPLQRERLAALPPYLESLRRPPRG